MESPEWGMMHSLLQVPVKSAVFGRFCFARAYRDRRETYRQRNINSKHTVHMYVFVCACVYARVVVHVRLDKETVTWRSKSDRNTVLSMSSHLCGQSCVEAACGQHREDADYQNGFAHSCRLSVVSRRSYLQHGSLQHDHGDDGDHDDQIIS